MAKTRRDVINEALISINVGSMHSGIDGEDYARGLRHFEGIWDELPDVLGVAVSFEYTNIPDWAWKPLANMVAGRVADAYTLPEHVAKYAKGLRSIKAQVASEKRRHGQSTPAVYF